MQKDFHYYALYYLSLCAGIEPDTAYKIAYSSQYVDDSTESDKIWLLDKRGKKGFIDPVRTAHNGLESFWKDVWEKIYYPFHFVPGHKKGSKDEQIKDEKYIDKEEKYITKEGKSNQIATEYLKKALKTKDPYRIGIALHPYADTYSHQNFSGRWSGVNNVEKMHVYVSNLRRKKLKLKLILSFYNLFRRPIPEIGHAEAVMVPDISNYSWVYFNYKNEYVPAANEERFLSYAENVYENILCKIGKKWRTEKEEIPFDTIKDKIEQGIYLDGRLKKKCRYWTGLISKKLNSKKIRKYDKYEWRKQALKGKIKWDKRKHLDQKRIAMAPKEDFLESHWLKFHRAALGHRIEALGILLDHELIPKKTYDEVKKKIVAEWDGKKIDPI